MLCSSVAQTARVSGTDPDTVVGDMLGCAPDDLSCSTVKGALSVMECVPTADT